jgi:uncharacterized peroxidase-related enzyme
MERFDYVTREAADGRVADLLTDWEGTGTANRSLLLGALANHPPLLEGMHALLDQTMREGSVDREYKELASVVVSQVNNCEYCTASHRENLLSVVGMDETAVEAIATTDYENLHERQRAVAHFAESVADDPKRVTENEFDRLIDAGFTDRECLELVGVVGTFVAANTYVDALSIHPADRETSYRTPEE